MLYFNRIKWCILRLIILPSVTYYFLNHTPGATVAVYYCRYTFVHAVNQISWFAYEHAVAIRTSIYKAARLRRYICVIQYVTHYYSNTVILYQYSSYLATTSCPYLIVQNVRAQVHEWANNNKLNILTALSIINNIVLRYILNVLVQILTVRLCTRVSCSSSYKA